MKKIKNKYPLLTIAIPTYNRLKYLKQLLPCVVKQVKDVNAEKDKVEIVISDNASSEDYYTYCSSFIDADSNIDIRYFRNNKNLGSERNFAKAISRAKGKYVWLIGDDDILLSNAVTSVLEAAENWEPSMIICIDALKITNIDPNKYYRPDDKAMIFPNYKKFLQYFYKKEKQLILGNTWIPSMIFRRNIFDYNISQITLPKDYSYMYAIVSGLRVERGSIYILNRPALGLRAIRAKNRFKNIPQLISGFIIQRILLDFQFNWRFPNSL